MLTEGEEPGQPKLVGSMKIARGWQEKEGCWIEGQAFLSWCDVGRVLEDGWVNIRELYFMYEACNLARIIINANHLSKAFNPHLV